MGVLEEEAKKDDDVKANFDLVNSVYSAFTSRATVIEQVVGDGLSFLCTAPRLSSTQAASSSNLSLAPDSPSKGKKGPRGEELRLLFVDAPLGPAARDIVSTVGTLLQRVAIMVPGSADELPSVKHTTGAKAERAMKRALGKKQLKKRAEKSEDADDTLVPEGRGLSKGEQMQIAAYGMDSATEEEQLHFQLCSYMVQGAVL